MVTTHLVPGDIRERFEVYEWRNATGVLETAHPSEWRDVIDMLRAFEFRRSEILAGGGSKGAIARRIDGFLDARGWAERKFDTVIRIDDSERASPTHKVDCVKGRVGLEIEWNNKDPFFDRDLNNFRLLFDLRVIDVGIIVTRATALQRLFRSLGSKVGAKYGAATTHMDKLLPRVEGGGGGGCPILAFGITRQVYVEDAAVAVDAVPADEEDDSDG